MTDKPDMAQSLDDTFTVMRLEPGDYVAVRLPEDVDNDAIDSMLGAIKAGWPGLHVLMFEGDIKVTRIVSSD